MSLNVVYLASGSGSTFEALALAHQQGKLPGQVQGLIVDRDCEAIGRSQKLKVPFEKLIPKNFPSYEKWDEQVKNTLLRMRADWVVSVGFLRKIGPQVIQAFPSRILNTHPSFLPHYSGHGMYGDKVHHAVLQAKAIETGVSLHFVNEIYDEGQIYAQRRVPVEAGDTLDSLKARVQKVEKEFLIEALSSLFRSGNQKP